MATEQPPVSTNGYVPQGVAGHDYAAQAVNASYAPASTVSATSSTAQGGNEIPKDQVGWYFVEQYYTTLSRSPEKLHVSDRASPNVQGRANFTTSSSTTSGLNSCLASKKIRLLYPLVKK